ncbi:hypothetical protein [Mycoplasmopsis verecunda]|uniref:Uncharacterized protein n=1 Tax=Mycoplasmopsis verecunda TaxID=171291 RepID=A0A1T4KG95_9BACT|nr:hypothetical protein [Mycoplasmopsis verecunda]WPB54233.1 hypothetical protein SAM46_01975 [Mycoplasmopsis verecunda]SJZ41458.1 hypothetical protein SAMN02745154_00053 [Mycoplasmopsis verecunda]
MSDEKTKNNIEKKKYIDLVEFRKKEIQHAILLAKKEKEKQNYNTEQKSLPWYKRDLFINLFGAGVALLIMILIILIAYLIKGI